MVKEILLRVVKLVGMLIVMVFLLWKVMAWLGGRRLGTIDTDGVDSSYYIVLVVDKCRAGVYKDCTIIG